MKFSLNINKLIKDFKKRPKFYVVIIISIFILVNLVQFAVRKFHKPQTPKEIEQIARVRVFKVQKNFLRIL